VNKYYYPLAGTRNPGVSLGVISVADHEVQWLVSQSDRPEYLVRFDWLQDSQQIAYQTLNRSQNLLQLFFVDLRSGGKNVVLEEKDPFWLNVEDLYYFFSDRPNFIWYSEFDGYRHLYLYDNSGSIIKQLTDGLWCVTSLVAVDEKRQLVYFTSNAENIIEQHLYSVNLINGECIRIDKEQAFHIVDFSLQNNFYIDKTETTDKPLELHLKSVTGQEILTLYKNRLFNQERYKFGTTVFLNVTADDGTPLKATLLYPYDFNPELKYPVLIYAHGGPREQLVQNKFPQIWHQLLAQRGYLIFILDNRGSYGRSRDWERKIFLELGRFELEDQLCGVHYLQDLTYVDSKRIGIWGSGYGGYLTLLALTQTPGNFKTGIAIEPIVDWKLYNTVFSERYMGLPTENSRGYWNSSPLNLASQLQADLLLIHGMQDDDIHLQHSIRFLNALENYNIPCQVLIYPEQKNLLRNSTERRHLYETMTRFLQEHL
jgi:dipeptidyl-peptidase-4